MAVYMCVGCRKIYDSKFLKETDEGYCCPDLECNCGHAPLVEIDELMVHAMRTLNRKGYTTRFCCSGGHKWKQSQRAYVMFEFGHMPDTLPEGWEIDKNYSLCIESYEKMIPAISALDEWCEKLPECDCSGGGANV